MINKDLLNILACPSCMSEVKLKAGKICCTGCKKKYPIRNGIPIMLIEEAEEEK